MDTAVLEQFEVVFRQVRNEPPVPVTDDDVGRDQLDADTDWLILAGEWRLSGQADAGKERTGQGEEPHARFGRGSGIPGLRPDAAAGFQLPASG